MNAKKNYPKLSEQQKRRYRFALREPQIAASAYIAPSADVIGDVTLGECASIWFNAVVRADIQSIRIGDYANIQDCSVLHLSEEYGVNIGQWTTVGHKAMLHACDIGDETLIGMSAVILDGAKIGNRCVIGASALITQGTVVPDGTMALGSPAKIFKPIPQAEQKKLKDWAKHYVETSRFFKENTIKKVQ